MASIFSNQPTGVLSGLKGRLGFGKNDDQYDQYNQYDNSLDDGYGEYEDGYDDYDDYNDDGYADEGYDIDQHLLNSNSASAPAKSSASTATSPRLITLDDVKASTSKMTSERYGKEPASPSRKRITVTTNDAYDEMVNTPAANARRESEAKENPVREAGGAGATGGFASSNVGASGASTTASHSARGATGVGASGVGGAGVGASHSVGGASSNVGTSGGSSSTSASPVAKSNTSRSHSSKSSHERSAGFNSLFTPSSSSPTSSTARGRRSVNIVRPQTYNDVANVAEAIRGGGVVVLYLAQTPERLQNRVLDFCFGVASALDAHVDSVGSQAYAITCGEPLTSAESASLTSLGIS